MLVYAPVSSIQPARAVRPAGTECASGERHDPAIEDEVLAYPAGVERRERVVDGEDHPVVVDLHDLVLEEAIADQGVFAAGHVVGDGERHRIPDQPGDRQAIGAARGDDVVAIAVPKPDRAVVAHRGRRDRALLDQSAARTQIELQVDLRTAVDATLQVDLVVVAERERDAIRPGGRCRPVTPVRQQAPEHGADLGPGLAPVVQPDDEFVL
jgi:hypothetical protein